ncbi:MAG: YceI family protein [Gammaproteobacteria bacterium]
MVFKRLYKTFLALGILALSVTGTTAAFAAEYEMDPAHTFIEFQASHLGFSMLKGRFNTFSGSFKWDKDNPGASSVNITIQADSVDSNWAERDKHLRGDDFLRVKEFPEITFKSSGYTGDADRGTMTGILTLRGVSKEVELDVERIGEGNDPWGGYRAGFRATTSINRMEYGSPRNLGPTSNTVELEFNVEGIRQ